MPSAPLRDHVRNPRMGQRALPRLGRSAALALLDPGPRPDGTLREGAAGGKWWVVQSATRYRRCTVGQPTAGCHRKEVVGGSLGVAYPLSPQTLTTNPGRGGGPPRGGSTQVSNVKSYPMPRVGRL